MARFLRVRCSYKLYPGVLLMVCVVVIYKRFVAHLCSERSARIFYRQQTEITTAAYYQTKITTVSSNQQNRLVLPAGGQRNQTAMIECSGTHFWALERECEALRGLGYTIINYSQHVDTVDLLWTLDTFRTPPNIKVKATLKNHIRATQPLYHKWELLAAENISVIRPAFVLPKQQKQLQEHLQRRMKKNPAALWVKKSLDYKREHITNTSDIMSSRNESFVVQEYLADPLLISNRKFDLGIYSLVTSMSPLRYYLYTGDFLNTFCTVDYLPFDPNIRGKYVNGARNMKVWNIPGLKELVGDTPGERNDKDIMYKYLDNHGYNTSKLQDNIVAAASEVGCKTEKKMAALFKKRREVSSSPRSFEFLQFNMAVQRDLSVCVIDINGTPVTYHEDAHGAMFVKLLTSTMLMAGLVNTSWTQQKVAENTNVNTVTDAEVNVDHEGCNKCSGHMCEITWTCSVCSVCLTEEDRRHFRTAVLEHRRQKDWIRIVPPPFKNQDVARKWKPMADPLYQSLSRSTQIMALWYHCKCLTDVAWCS